MAAPDNNRNAAHGDVSYTAQIQVRVTVDDKRIYTAMAESQGLNLPKLVRSLLRREYREYCRINGGPRVSNTDNAPDA